MSSFIYLHFDNKVVSYIMIVFSCIHVHRTYIEADLAKRLLLQKMELETDFKSWMKLFVIYLVLMPLGKA